ncbi:MAG: hypothetical protein A2176_03555 [Spirochaetes bacterium RBG_13_51_14]|nr:MAG: hypothetical protein A2176_03555 [Spirochaetes bacterium RBG_13_51_14]
MQEQLWLDAANAVVRAGLLPIPLTDTLYELIKTVLTSEQAAFIPVFSGPMNIDQTEPNSATCSFRRRGAALTGRYRPCRKSAR